MSLIQNALFVATEVLEWILLFSGLEVGAFRFPDHGILVVLGVDWGLDASTSEEHFLSWVYPETTLRGVAVRALHYGFRF